MFKSLFSTIGDVISSAGPTMNISGVRTYGGGNPIRASWPTKPAPVEPATVDKKEELFDESKKEEAQKENVVDPQVAAFVTGLGNKLKEVFKTDEPVSKTDDTTESSKKALSEILKNLKEKDFYEVMSKAVRERKESPTEEEVVKDEATVEAVCMAKASDAVSEAIAEVIIMGMAEEAAREAKEQQVPITEHAVSPFGQPADVTHYEHTTVTQVTETVDIVTDAEPKEKVSEMQQAIDAYCNSTEPPVFTVDGVREPSAIEQEQIDAENAKEGIKTEEVKHKTTSKAKHTTIVRPAVEDMEALKAKYAKVIKPAK